MPTIAEQFIQKGRLEGRQEGKQEDILDILEMRFSFVSPEIKLRLDAVDDPVLLKQLLKSAVTIRSCDEFLRLLAGE